MRVCLSEKWEMLRFFWTYNFSNSNFCQRLVIKVLGKFLQQEFFKFIVSVKDTRNFMKKWIVSNLKFKQRYCKWGQIHQRLMNHYYRNVQHFFRHFDRWWVFDRVLILLLLILFLSVLWARERRKKVASSSWNRYPI